MSTLSPDLELEPAWDWRSDPAVANAFGLALDLDQPFFGVTAPLQWRPGDPVVYKVPPLPVIPAARGPHGTRSSYVAQGCRCAPCSAANAEYFRERRSEEREEREDPLRACQELLSSLRSSGGDHGNTLRTMVGAERLFDSDQMCGYRQRRIGVVRGENAFASWDRVHCGKISCLHCGPGKIEETVRRMLSLWGEDPVHRIELESAEEWKRESRAIRQDSEGRYLRIAVEGSAGSVVYGPGLDGEPVANIGRQLTEDILRAPLEVEKGGFRVRRGKVVRAAEKAEREQAAAERPESLWKRNPSYTLEELRAEIVRRGFEMRRLGDGKKADDRHRANLSDDAAAEIIERIRSVETALEPRLDHFTSGVTTGL
jgi:hypothetical protein